ncbi:MAG: recombinase family protein [Anaerolineae bacterium]|nr:recombinase family protein [Anaerolineae bacterium]
MRILLGYGRKSVADSADVLSLQRQRAAVERIATDQGLELEWHQDHDLSGFYEDNRPEWQKVLARLADPDVAGIAAETLDRIYRNNADFQRFKAQLDSLGKVLLIGNLAGVDGTTAMGKFVLDLQASLAELEYRTTSERYRRTFRHLKQNKGRHIGAIPFGCDRDPYTKNLIPTVRYYYINPDSGWTSAGPLPDELTGKIEAPSPPDGFETRFYHDALRELFTLYSHGDMSLMDTNQQLNESGWRFWNRKRTCPQPFNRVTVDSVIRRAYVYAGEIEPGQPGAHDPILPVELCQAVQRAKAKRKMVRSNGRGNKSHREYLLSGVIFCGRCGKKMCGQSQPRHAPGKRYYYRHMYQKQGCPERDILAGGIEAQVIEELAKIDREGLVRNLIDDIQALFRQGASMGDQSYLEELDGKKSEVERLIDLYQTGVITKEQLIARKAPLDSEIEKLKNQVEVTSFGTMSDVEAVVNEVVGSLGKLHEASPDLQKVILLSLLERVEVEGGHITGIKPLPWAKPFFRFWLMSTSQPSS